MSWRDHIKVHPAADLFPLLKDTDPKALQDLADDIKANGGPDLPIMFFGEGDEAELLDGRNRLDACELAGLDITKIRRVDMCPTHTDPYAFVISANVHRRHLSAEDKTKVVADLLKAKAEWSDRAIAKAAQVSPTTVGKARAKANVQSGHKTERQEASGRKARGRKPGEGRVHEEGSPATASNEAEPIPVSRSAPPVSPPEPAAESQSKLKLAINELVGLPPGAVDPVEIIMELIKALPDGHLERFTLDLFPYLVKRFEKGSMQWAAHDLYNNRTGLASEKWRVPR